MGPGARTRPRPWRPDASTLLLSDAIRHAREGYAVSGSEARFKTSEEAALYAVPGFAEAFLTEGKRMSAGTVRQVPRLAGTLGQLAMQD